MADDPDLDLLIATTRASAERQGYVLGGKPHEQEVPPPSTMRTRRCQRCQGIYDEMQPRTQAEIERLHQTLFIGGADCHVELRFCDSCYEQVVETVTRRNNNSSFDNGSSNCGPPNWLLQQKYGK